MASSSSAFLRSRAQRCSCWPRSPHPAVGVGSRARAERASRPRVARRGDGADGRRRRRRHLQLSVALRLAREQLRPQAAGLSVPVLVRLRPGVLRLHAWPRSVRRPLPVRKVRVELVRTVVQRSRERDTDDFRAVDRRVSNHRYLVPYRDGMNAFRRSRTREPRFRADNTRLEDYEPRS